MCDCIKKRQAMRRRRRREKEEVEEGEDSALIRRVEEPGRELKGRREE